MKPRRNLIIIGVVALLAVLGALFSAVKNIPPENFEPSPSPTPELSAVQLPPNQHPQVSLKFSSDGHYVTVTITNISADYLEYNLIYDAKVKNNRLQTGVNANSKTAGKSTYTQQQLLGSESSGKFTYHTDIQNAVMELTLRNAANRSIFTSTYPFTVSPGKTIDLLPTS